jgi:hypothetical protein
VFCKEVIFASERTSYLSRSAVTPVSHRAFPIGPIVINYASRNVDLLAKLAGGGFRVSGPENRWMRHR